MPVIFYYIADNPEDNAMLQAMYSRSDKSIKERIKDLEKLDSGKFMSQYYVGYGHGSIGDCGSVTVYIEEVSMVASVAIQHHMLYNGQEMSTRYIDFRNQGFYNPLSGTEHERTFAELYEKFREFYVSVQDDLTDRYAKEYPYSMYSADGVNERVWRNAVKAKALDKAREFIPVCTHTSLSLHGSISALRDNATRLLSIDYDGLTETAEIAKGLIDTLAENVPNSVGEMEDFIKTADKILPACFVLDDFGLNETNSTTSAKVVSLSSPDIPDSDELSYHHALRSCLRTGGDKTRFPIGVSILDPRITVLGVMSYGAYRDVHRHRTLYRDCSLPTLSSSKFSNCLNYLSDERKQEFIDLVNLANDKLGGLEGEPVNYLAILGTPVTVALSGQLDAWNYFISLRSGPSVHYDVRNFIRSMREQMKKLLDTDDDIYHKQTLRTLLNYVSPTLDDQKDDLYIERGKQTIEKK